MPLVDFDSGILMTMAELLFLSDQRPSSRLTWTKAPRLPPSSPCESGPGRGRLLRFASQSSRRCSHLYRSQYCLSARSPRSRGSRFGRARRGTDPLRDRMHRMLVTVRVVHRTLVSVVACVQRGERWCPNSSTLAAASSTIHVVTRRRTPDGLIPRCRRHLGLMAPRRRVWSDRR